jgi:hypothetical protein
MEAPRIDSEYFGERAKGQDFGLEIFDITRPTRTG